MQGIKKCASCRYCRVRTLVQFTGLVMLGAFAAAVAMAEGFI